jgi:ABC-type sugar transport system substrate-binding protein
MASKGAESNRNDERNHVKKKFDRVGYVALLAAMVAGVTACGSGSASNSSSGHSGNKIAYLQPLASDPSVQSVTLGIQCAAKKSGDTILLFDAGFDQNKQINQFNTAMTQGAAGIISHGVNSPGMYPSYARASKDHVPVIDYVGPNDHPPNATYVGEDPVAVAQATVDALLKEVPSGGKALMIGGPPAVAGVTPRVNAFRAAAQKAGIEILGEEDSLTLAANDVQGKASSLVLKNPQANILWGVTAATAATAGQVAQRQGKAVGTGMFVAGVGASTDVANNVRQGVLTDMIDADNYAQGEAMVRLMDDAIAGKSVSSPPFTYKAYTSANIDSWVPPAQRCGQ